MVLPPKPAPSSSRFGSATPKAQPLGTAVPRLLRTSCLCLLCWKTSKMRPYKQAHVLFFTSSPPDSWVAISWEHSATSWGCRVNTSRCTQPAPGGYTRHLCFCAGLYPHHQRWVFHLKPHCSSSQVVYAHSSCLGCLAGCTVCFVRMSGEDKAGVPLDSGVVPSLTSCGECWKSALNRPTVNPWSVQTSSGICSWKPSLTTDVGWGFHTFLLIFSLMGMSPTASIFNPRDFLSLWLFPKGGLALYRNTSGQHISSPYLAQRPVHFTMQCFLPKKVITQLENMGYSQDRNSFIFHKKIYYSQDIKGCVADNEKEKSSQRPVKC